VLPLTLHQALALLAWFPLAALLFFLVLIARFYQKFSGRKTYARFYLAPAILFGAGYVRAASAGRGPSDPIADLLFASGGIVLIGLTTLLYRRMIVSRAPTPRS
jgi:hypothetical protein